MGCFILDDSQFNAIGSMLNYYSKDISFMLKEYGLTNDAKENINNILNILLKENIFSFNYGYDKKVEFYKIEFKVVPVTAMEFIKTLKCYMYQSCEHDTWDDSIAKEIALNLIAWGVNYLDGYNESKGW